MEGGTRRDSDTKKEKKSEARLGIELNQNLRSEAEFWASNASSSGGGVAGEPPPI